MKTREREDRSLGSTRAAPLALAATFAVAFALSAARASADEPAFVAQAEGPAPERKADTPASPLRVEEPQRFESLIDNLIITGKRRQDELQQVPIALTEFGSLDFERNNQRGLDDIPRRVPNLILDQGIGMGNTPRMSLRGLSTNQSSAAADPVIGVYVDGVYRSRLTGSLLTLFDVERVEVLRGPQGTLFGKNSVGGAINITTKGPNLGEFEGSAELRIGNYGLVESRLAVNVPLIPEKAAVRLSLATATRDGYQKNVLNDTRAADNKVLGGRLQFAYLPRPDLDLQLTLEQTRENREGLATKCVPIGNGNGVPSMIAASVGFREACARDRARDDLKYASEIPFKQDDLSTVGASFRAIWDITPSVTLSSIFGWRRQESAPTLDVDATEVPLLGHQNSAGGDTQNQFSQEFRLTGRAFDDRLKYIAGVFGLAEENNEREFFGLNFQPVFGPMGFQGTRPSSVLNRNVLKIDNRSYAAYAQAIYSVTDRLELTVGARITKDRKRVLLDTRVTSCRPGPDGDPCRALRGTAMDPIGFGAMGPDSFTGFERSGRFSEITPSAKIAYAVSPTLLVYASYAKGFQSGGFDGRAASLADAKELENQVVTAYETGLKSTWFEDRLTLNATYFYNILEEGTRIPVATVTEGGQLAQSQGLNATALVRGGELEISMLPLDGLQLTGSLGVQRSEIDDSAATRMAGLPRNSRLPIVPNYTMNFGLDYTRPLGRFGTLGINTSWSHRGGLQPTIQDTEELAVSKFGLLDGRISYELPDGQTEIAAFGTNLLDRRYFFAGFSSEDSFGFGVRFFGPPRMYGLEVRRRF